MPVRLTDSQIQAYVDAFDQADKNEDGLISRQELFKLLQDVNLAQTQEEMTEALRTLSLNNDYITRANTLHIAKQLLENQKTKAAVTAGLNNPGSPTADRRRLADKVSGWLAGEASSSDAAPAAGSYFASTIQRPNKKVTATDDKVVVDVDPPEEIEDFEYYSYSSDDEDETANVLKSAVVNDRRASKSVTKDSNKEDDQARQQLLEKKRQEEKAKRIAEMAHRGKKTAAQEDGPRVSTGPPGVVKHKSPLLDPRVRKQMVRMREHLPYFIYFVSVIQVLLLAVSLYMNGGFESFSINPFGGPSQLTVIQLGAKYVPCMKPDPKITSNYYVSCDPKYPKNGVKSLNGTCFYYDNLAFICGMGGFSQAESPDQIWRFMTSVFMHTGLIHLAVNMLVQIYVAVPMERQMGPLRFGMVYMISGVAGNLLSAIVQPKSVSVGSSGALFGLFAVLLLELIHNWPILTSPIRDAILLAFKIGVALCVGLLPYIDNFSHIGGFLAGIFSGLIFGRTIEFSDWDRRRKRLLMLMAVPVLITGLAILSYMFWTRDGGDCSWCRYLDCLPVGSAWCSVTGS